MLKFNLNDLQMIHNEFCHETSKSLLLNKALARFSLFMTKFAEATPNLSIDSRSFRKEFVFSCGISAVPKKERKRAER